MYSYMLIEIFSYSVYKRKTVNQRRQRIFLQQNNNTFQTTVLKRPSGALHRKKNRELISRVFNIMFRR